MKALTRLPEDYREKLSINLQKDKKLALLINALAILVIVILVVPMHFYIPIWTMFDMSQGMTRYILRFVILIAALIGYMVLHEMVHGMAMKLCGTQKVKYGFTGLYAYAGSEDYYDKKSYLFIALAPVVLWGVVLVAINLLVPEEWFWVVYLIQVGNLSGAAGDAYVTARFGRLPNDILIKDLGIGMTVFSRE